MDVKLAILMDLLITVNMCLESLSAVKEKTCSYLAWCGVGLGSPYRNSSNRAESFHLFLGDRSSLAPCS